MAAASEEARAAGVRVGLPLAQARRLVPDAAFRRGDLDTYGRISEEVTAVLLAASRRVERPSADEAFVDLSSEPHPALPHPAARAVPPVRAAETIRDELQRRLGLDASLGLASSRLAARIASGWAKPRGLLVVLPGYERSFVEPKPVALLGLPPHVEAALERAGLLDARPGGRGRARGARGGDRPARPRTCARRRAARASPRSHSPRRPRSCRKRPRSATAAATRSRSRRSPTRSPGGPRAGSSRSASGPARSRSRCAERPTRRAAPSRSPIATDDEDKVAEAARTLALPLVEPADAVRGLLVRVARLGPDRLAGAAVSRDAGPAPRAIESRGAAAQEASGHSRLRQARARPARSRSTRRRAARSTTGTPSSSRSRPSCRPSAPTSASTR